MILLFFFFNLELSNKIDTLKSIVDKNPKLSIITELNMCYFMAGQDSLGIELIKKYYDLLGAHDNAALRLQLADDYLYTGDILEARDVYLKLVSRYPGSVFANDALEKLYMIESARLDTTTFKSLGYSIFLYKSSQFDAAKDSLKNLVKTRLGDYALYFLALTFIKQENLGQALGALDNLTTSFPDHKIHNAALLQAGIYIDLNKEKEARAILEELVVREPTSIYAVRARGMLENNFE